MDRRLHCRAIRHAWLGLDEILCFQDQPLERPVQRGPRQLFCLFQHAPLGRHDDGASPNPGQRLDVRAVGTARTLRRSGRTRFQPPPLLLAVGGSPRGAILFTIQVDLCVSRLALVQQHGGKLYPVETRRPKGHPVPLRRAGHHGRQPLRQRTQHDRYDHRRQAIHSQPAPGLQTARNCQCQGPLELPPFDAQLRPHQFARLETGHACRGAGMVREGRNCRSRLDRPEGGRDSLRTDGLVPLHY
mmetsp:Transcript_21235/g.59056  ORF Transcript_21235/g.59056 Transcript_21235/m.59056 type:complete len:244 (-) Transcript_21235:580-1311(-)